MCLGLGLNNLLPPMATQNSLGLDFEQLSVQEASSTQPDVQSSPDLPAQKAEKKKPYVNAERVKTGGPQRVRTFSVVSVQSHFSRTN